MMFPASHSHKPIIHIILRKPKPMVDPLTIAGQVINIGNIIYQAVKLIDSLKAAPGEFTTTILHVQSLNIVLESLHTEVIDNPHSIINRQNNLRAAKRSEIARYISHCERSLKRVELLLKKYHDVLHSTWVAWRWSSKGKQEVDSIHADIMFWTQLMNVFMAREGLVSLWKIEVAMDDVRRLMQQLAAGGHPLAGGYSTGNRGEVSQKKWPKLGGMILASFFISRLKARLRRRYRTGKGGQKSSFPKSVCRVGTLKRKTTLLADYAGTLAEEPINRQSKPGSQRFECWQVSSGRYAIGGPALHAGKQVRRGQMQLKEMADLFQAAGTGSTTGVDYNHAAVKWLLRSRNSNSRRRWVLAAARMESTESSPHGMIRTKKVMVVLKTA